MAYSKEQWFSDEGVACSSEADAKWADAINMLRQFITERSDALLADRIMEFIGNDNAKEFDLLLSSYVNAMEVRHREVYSGK